MASPKPNQGKDLGDADHDDKGQESNAPKVPPLKIVIPGGGSGARNEQEGEGVYQLNATYTLITWLINRVLLLINRVFFNTNNIYIFSYSLHPFDMILC